MRRFAFGMLALVFCAGAARAEDCTLKQIASLPIIENDTGSPIVSILIDDKPRKALLDTGGFWSLLDPTIADDYHPRRSDNYGSLGTAAIKLDKVARVPSVQIGQMKVNGVDFLVAPAAYMNVDVTLGANWLKVFDVEIDPVEKKVLLISQDHCEGGVMHWPHSDVAVVPLRIDWQHHITIPVTLNGEEIQALIDTGASDTILSLSAAGRYFGLTPDSPGMEHTGESVWVKGTKAKGLYRYQFKSLNLDGISIQNPYVRIEPKFGDGPDLIIGMHHLQALHLYFAYGERKLYATTTKADVALRQTSDAGVKQPAEAPDRVNASDMLRQGDEALQAQDLAQARVAYDRALALDPGNAEALTHRAALSAQQHDYDRALDDANAAIKARPDFAPAFIERAGVYEASGQHDNAQRDLAEATQLEPGNPRVYLQRSLFYKRLQDYQHAFADADAAVKLAPKSAMALNARCWVGAIMGQLDGALADCNAALKLVPHAPAILDSRALVHLKAGRLDDAIDDYDSALERAPKLASSLYGRGLAERQKGKTAAADADIAAATAIDPKIADHFGK